jgi:hypothetical protein
MNNLGVIEGFFGEPWSWQVRLDYAQFLKENGYSFYIYAPKEDEYLRKNWQQDWPDTQLAELIKLGNTYQQKGLQWGIGFSPLEIYLNYDRTAIEALEKKILYFNKLNLDILAILFDDMRGDFQEISQIQAEITHRIIDRSNAKTFIMCPTYYTNDPILDKLFGNRPSDYLEKLGKILEPEVRVFWTGPQVCSKSYPEEHLQEVAQKLGRKPFIWDNYPVNDGAKIRQYLHLKPFIDRPYQMERWISGHAVNPMNQAYLSKIPLMTLPWSYQRQEKYFPTEAFAESVTKICPENLAKVILEDIELFQEKGLNMLPEALKKDLIDKYESFQTPYSREIVRWLNNEYTLSSECLTG